MAKAKEEMGTAGILFFDVKGYSDLSGSQMEAYHTKIWPALHKIAIEKYGRYDTKKYLYKNTWGDGIVLLHEDHYKLANIALEWNEYFIKNRYITDADPLLNQTILEARIALHYGEYHTVFDPFQDQTIYFGREIIRAARIEPIAEPGHVWVTPDVKSFVEKREKEEKVKRFDFIDYGERELAKHFEKDRIFEIIYKGPNSKKSKPDRDVASAATVLPPEEKEDIDPETAKRIKSLTNEDPVKEDVTICSVTREPICPVKAGSLRVIAELTKNGEAAGEELEFAFVVRSIEKSAIKVWEAYEDKTIEFTHLAKLYHNIGDFFNCFGGEMQEDNARKFLGQKSLTQKELNEAEAFVRAIKKFKDKCDETTEWYIDEKFNLNAAIPLIKGCLIDIVKTSGNFARRLRNTGLDRIRNTKDAIREAFDKFRRYKLVMHLKNAISALSSKCRSLPPVFD